MIALAAAVLVAFVGGLMFIAHHKKEEKQEALPHKSTGPSLPPKPEERWKYIKELENRDVTVPAPTEPSAGGEVRSPAQLTDEQRQLLDQMAADMRQQPTQLNEVPWNEQTPAQQQQTLRQQREYAQQQRDTAQQTYQQQQARAQAQAQAQEAERQQRLERQQQQLKRQQAERQQRLERQQQAATERQQRETTAQAETRNSAQTEHRPAPITSVTPSAAAPAPAATPAPARQAEATTGKRWIIQCGSFKGSAQAESARAGLAFEGFESRITVGGGWNRVVIGPYADRSKVDSIVKQLRGNGHGNCITLPFRG